MLCQNCQKRMANVHFTQVINNNKVEMHLCEQCAKEKGQFKFGPTVNFNDFLTGFIGYDGYPSYASPVLKPLVCDKCGLSFEEFQKIGKLGCSHCYETYKEKLGPLIKRIHGGLEHHGKVPAKVSIALKSSREAEDFKEQLNKAIENEEYEKAAEIRDRIKGLESDKK
jgi:protein arginine kinase activator